jgi:arylsulfatase A-like enzyme
MNRCRSLLFILILVGCLNMLAELHVWAADDTRPNILVIITDQQFSGAMSCAMGDKYLSTPNMDSLAANGMRFTRAYAPNPLCMPMRTSMMTGRYPHQTGIESNTKKGFDESKHVFMGKIFQKAGYETAYFGKWHVPVSTKKSKVHGFEIFEEKKARMSPTQVVRFLKKKHKRPFLAVASFLGPHEICEWARKQKIPGDMIGDPPPLNQRPPLLTNFKPPENETDIMTHMRKSYQAHRLFPVGDYNEADWRRLRWGYFRLIERVDGVVGSVLNALRDSGLEKNTVIVFLSDHGDCHGAHQWNQKTVFYDESARVPFIISWKGKTPVGTSDVLLNTGVDMIPTLCDFAGIDAPKGLPGKSLKAPAMGKTPSWKRDYVIVQNHMVQCEPIEGKDLKPRGRMVRSDGFKYCVYNEGKRRESLIDMKADPGEMKNLVGNAKYHKILKQHRQYLIDWGKVQGDQFPVPKN